MRAVFCLLPVLLLTGCTWTAVTEVEPGQFFISSHGSIFNSREGLLENIEGKARRACAGRPYRLEGDAAADTLVAGRPGVGVPPSSVLSMTAICEAP